MKNISESSNKFFMYGLSDMHRRTDGRTAGRAGGRTGGRTDGRTCNDIVLSRHDRKTHFEKIFPRVRKTLQLPVWSGLRALVDGRTDGRADGRTNARTDGRTDGQVTTLCSVMTVKNLCEKIFMRIEKILQVPVLRIFSEISLSPQT